MLGSSTLGGFCTTDAGPTERMNRKSAILICIQFLIDVNSRSLHTVSGRYNLLSQSTCQNHWRESRGPDVHLRSLSPGVPRVKETSLGAGLPSVPQNLGPKPTSHKGNG